MIADPLQNGARYLNLACGTKMHPLWTNVDFSPYAKLARRPSLSRFLRTVGILSQPRYERLQQVDPGILCYDLLKPLPYPDGTFDVVYHSHFLEHVDRQAAPRFLKECHRLLKPGGILRIALPDLFKLADAYLQTFTGLQKNSQHSMDEHTRNVENLFDQMVRTEAAGSREQKKIVRWIERLLGHNAKDSGELHRWMYDFFTLEALLKETGFRSVQEHSAVSSSIPNWASFQLDTLPDGTVYKPESLFVEGTKT